jgi:hypothetical protein
MASIEDLKGSLSSGAARSNRYRIFLPSEYGASGRQVSALCRATNIPGRQIMTNERAVGMVVQKMPYSFLTEDVNLTFTVDEAYTMRRYFENWQKAIIGFNTYELEFKETFAKTVVIQHLSHGKGERPIYTCRLLKAFPTTMNAIELGDDQTNTISQLNVQLSYTDWESA